MTAAYSFVYAVTAKSSLLVLAELLKVSEAAPDQIAETRTGFAVAISIPGDSNSGAIYAYDRPTSSMSILSVDQRDSDFTAKEIGVMFPEVVRHLNAPSHFKAVAVVKQREFKPAHRNEQKHNQQQHRNHRQRKNQNIGTKARPQLLQAAA